MIKVLIGPMLLAGAAVGWWALGEPEDSRVAPAEGECLWCGAFDAPEGPLGPVMTIGGPDEPGRRLVLRGRVFEADRRTPAAGVLVYAFHTDAEGVYRREGQESLTGRRHGALRGWLRTDEAGRYEIRTIVPAPYPERTEPAHVHVTLRWPGLPEECPDVFMFEHDDLLTAAQRRADRELGSFGAIVGLVEAGDGVLVGTRDFVPAR